MAALDDAFAAEALPHMDALFRAARRMVRDPSLAADAVQEAYLIAWRSFGSYRPGTNCRAWLFGILFNVVRGQRRDHRAWTWAPETPEPIAPAPIPEGLTDAALLAALDDLPEASRAVLLLVDVEELTYKEAAAALGIPAGTVMSRLSRARAALRGRLAG